MTDPLLSSVLRLRAKAKALAKPRVRNPYRHRTKAIKLMQEERRAKQAVRDAKKINFTKALNNARETVMVLAQTMAEDFPGHDKEHYYKLIMQMPTKKAKRVISQWCAYLSMEMERLNAARAAEKGDGSRRDRVTEPGVLKEISERWAKLSAEERHAITADKVKELEERRENRMEAVHNSNISACHDARVTLKNIKTELENLHKRTGTAILLLATRGTIDAFGDPVVHCSDPRVQQFVESTVGATLEDTVLRMEAYCVSGVQGVVGNQLERTQILKTQLRNLILSKLQHVAQHNNRGEIGRMNYTNFDDNITAKFGIVAENWATKFQSPSAMSHLEVEISLRAWESGTTRFRALTMEEWRAWLHARYHPQLAASESTAPETTTMGPETVETPSVAPSAAALTSPSGSAMPDGENPSGIENAANVSPVAATGPSNPGAPSMSSAAVPENRSTAELGPDTPVPVAHVSAPPLSVNFINSVAPTVQGDTFVVPKAARKKRSDAGIPRGPRKSKTSPATGNTQSRRKKSQKNAAATTPQAVQAS